MNGEGHWQVLLDIAGPFGRQFPDVDFSGATLYWTWFNTETSDFFPTRFAVRPLGFLCGDEREEGYDLALPEVTPESRVITTINNHHLGLNPRIIFANAMVNQPDVYLTIHKFNRWER